MYVDNFAEKQQKDNNLQKLVNYLEKYIKGGLLHQLQQQIMNEHQV